MEEKIYSEMKSKGKGPLPAHTLRSVCYLSPAPPKTHVRNKWKGPGGGNRYLVVW